MHSPDDPRDSDNAQATASHVQNTLDAFEPTDADEDGQEDQRPRTPTPPSPPAVTAVPDLRQMSMDSFPSVGPGGDGSGPHHPPSRAMEGLALEMEMERTALTEAEGGITRDELLITVAREVKVSLEDLDLVDSYLTDLELEGRVRRVGEVVVLPYPEDEDLLAMDLSDREFLARYRRRHPVQGGGAGA